MLGLVVTNYCGFAFPLCRVNYGYYAKQSQFNRTGTRQSDFNPSLVSQIPSHNGNVPNTYNDITTNVGLKDNSMMEREAASFDMPLNNEGADWKLRLK